MSKASRLHQPSGRTTRGVALALVTVFCWSTLPIALELVLDSMDGPTITWWRFAGSAATLAMILAARGTLPHPGMTGKRGAGLLLLATLALSGNYLGYIVGLGMTNAGTTQVMIQMAPVLLGLGSIVVFRESFARVQWLGLLVMATGLLLFSNDQVRHLIGNADRYFLGIGVIAAAAVSWTIYGLSQKQLLHKLDSPQILLTIYVGAVIVFTPFAEITAISRLNGVELAALAYSTLNMLVAYGAFAESLAHLEAARVSALLAIVPLVTLGILAGGAAFFPELVEPEPVTGWSVLGAALVVGGSMTVAGARRG